MSDYAIEEQPMARMPGATWTGEHSPQVPMTQYDIVCIHTIVGYAPAHAAHFSTKAAGEIIQSRDTRYRSAANLHGNPRVIAIENEDHGPRFGGTPQLPKWVPLTPEQVEACAKILAWSHLTHGVPLQLCPNSKPGSKGLAYHRQGIDGNFGPGTPYPNPGRVPGGEVWSESRGKVCPSDVRIEQRDEILARAKQIVRERRSADNATYTAGGLNAPTTTNKGSKRNLLKPAARVYRLIKVMWRLHLDVIGLQEVGTVTRTVFKRHPHWLYLPAGPNTVTPINRKGSALVLRKSQFKVLHAKAIKVPYAQAFRRTLKQPRVLTADPNTRQRNLWISAHPPRRTEPVAQRKVLAHVADACLKAIRQHIGVVVLADTNNIALAKEILGNVGMRLVESADVEGVFVSKDIKVLDTGVETNDVARVITDHPGGLPWAELELRDSVNTTATRIPT